MSATTSETAQPPSIGAGGIKFTTWLKRVGVDRTTGWRWRERGWIRTTAEISGHLYLTAAEEARFWARAQAGEFSRNQSGMEEINA